MADMAGGKLYRRWIDELWNGSYAGVREIVAPDFVFHQPGQEDVIGPDPLVERIAQAREPFSDIAFEISVGPIAEGDLVAGRWTARGRYAGGLPGATAEPGTRIEFSGTDVLRVRDGLLAEYWVSSDGMHLMSQLGAM